MKAFLDENFLLQNKTAERLYHDFAVKMPLIDYHCHLAPEQIANNINFKNLTQAWLAGDHYKWRALRTNGVEEAYCTGNKSDEEKFMKWAETVPYTLRNPLYHWTHLELQRYFGIKDILNPSSAKKIYDEASAQLQNPAFSTQGLIKKMNVRVICTTDDPIDSLAYHQAIKESEFTTKVLPAFRPDKAMEISNAANFIVYLSKLEKASKIPISSFDDEEKNKTSKKKQ